MPDQDVKSLDRAGLAEALGSLGEPAYRTGQLVRWLYGRGATSFEQMTDLPGALRDKLAERFSLSFPSLVRRQVSPSDGTRKYLWRLGDGTMVEGVGLPAGGLLTVCLSTQVGCVMGCSFCATGRGGFVRNLLPGEIADQVSAVALDFGRRATNAVAMGQGEPFANYDATLVAFRFLNSKDGAGIGARHLTISTSGVVPGIRRLASEPEQFTLAVSLHSAVQPTRDALMPGVARWPLPELLAALAAYTAARGRRVTLEYTLVDGANDNEGELQALLRFCEGLLCHVNLIPVNAVAGSALERSSQQRVERFRHALRSAGVEASVRVERGADIDAACGQLRQRCEP
ncbi:MAG TPA: 23S rRNA (adenine(2503)-C(2))-methyltransferase RlmN [Coriobacteriia bacterium]|jgi:23S rRNA (adenine2503-C2)-methyltransferase